MPLYKTQYVKNLLTGEPLTLEVEDRGIINLSWERMLTYKRSSSLYGQTEQIITKYELSFLPSYKEVLKIFRGNGYTNDLVSLILKDFGLDDSGISSLLADDSFVRKIRGEFKDINCDRGRATKAMLVVYKEAERRIQKT